MNNNLGNKETMAKNLKYYMDLKGISATDISAALGFPLTTISNWIHANTYPRIDKIEMLANYFGISKADLVEDNPGPAMYDSTIPELIDLYSRLNASQKDAFLVLLRKMVGE